MSDIGELTQQFSDLLSSIEALRAQHRAQSARIDESVEAIAGIRADLREEEDAAGLLPRLAAELASLAELRSEQDEIARAIQAGYAELNAVRAALQQIVDAGPTFKHEPEDAPEQKAFWDPEDDEDRAMLGERIDALAARVLEVEQADDPTYDMPEEIDELRAELSDLLNGLTDDTRFRVQSLIDRLDAATGTKSARPPNAGGAHHLYR
jgi:chromosome segregation ATPase